MKTFLSITMVLLALAATGSTIAQGQLAFDGPGPGPGPIITKP